MSTEVDLKYLELAVKLAKKGYGFVSPNPIVGAVIVKNGEIIGTGYHEFYGGPHAEVEAIRNANSSVEGATIYISLEPCRHTGKTPPCAELLLESKVSRIVYADIDQNPKFKISLSEYFKDSGIILDYLPLPAATWLNRKFHKFIKTGRPYITIKYGATIDSKIADSSFNSKWITSDSAREYVHKLRAGHDAILVGSNTLIKDNPNLGLHGIEARKDPIRLILSSRTDLVAKYRNYSCFRDNNYAILPSIEELWNFCQLNNISSIFIEGGAGVISEFISNRLFDELLVFIGPKVLGSKHIDAISEISVDNLDSSLNLSFKTVKTFQDTVLLKYTYNT